MEFLHPAMWHDYDIDFDRRLHPVACGSGIMTVNSPSGSTLQCDTWLWDGMPMNSPGGSALQIWHTFGSVSECLPHAD